MKKYLFKISVLIFLLILQLTIPIFFPSLKLIPDFILIYVVIRAIIFGAQDAMIYGAIGGLLQDVFITSFIGLFTPVKTAVTFLAALLSGRFFPENLLIPPLGVFLATIVHELLYLLLKDNYLFAANYLTLIKELILPLAALNALITFFVYLIYFFWERRDLSGQT
ncbi:MAG: rod shape-determining protein MreD [Halanaerobium sp. 4-GBenrich]|uniref:Rod shape-determining protein MreD n=1 Tax=Halanaerobium congolense TaxID=54121 RepID=A0A1G6N4P0_9FIRM|nr:rod shape-determining protein MreD [Halanaerobium congolense]ODS51026.1 MAG: rod shape-determining protein MreD [Halanaerobium sp. 4-GBenrich]PTX17504.1 rod shape-determining protein MreD [Halanaerobium congolense]SDC62105.1 rod shape-determining protein MreD [Halanaerobium congolense]SDE97879.1 rod shape-determining protein MreD [Halanaerobium congolense]SDK74318.1 rod shape-determining protein MreD [Halanaerobium congolense]